MARGESKHIILNKGKNPAEGGQAVMHHRSWDRNINVRNFNVPTAGEYVLRIRAKSRVPERSQVVAAMEKILGKRRDDEIGKRPERERHIVEQYERDLEHFKTDRMYDDLAGAAAGGEDAGGAAADRGRVRCRRARRVRDPHRVYNAECRLHARVCVSGPSRVGEFLVSGEG